MRKITYLFVIFTALFIMILQVVGCADNALFMEPSDYSAVSYNIVWTECTRKIHTTYFPSKVYYRIADVPIDEYVACQYSDGGLGPELHPVLMKHKDFENTLDLDTSTAKLYLGGFDINFSTDDWFAYEPNIIKQEVCQIDSVIAEQLAKQISADSPEYINVEEFENWSDNAKYMYNSDGDVLRLHFSLEEYDNLRWVAFIVKCEESYFIEINEDPYSAQYLPCGDELSSLIKEVTEEYGLSTNGTLDVGAIE